MPIYRHSLIDHQPVFAKRNARLAGNAPRPSENESFL